MKYKTKKHITGGFFLTCCLAVFSFHSCDSLASSEESKNAWHFTTKIYPKLLKAECGSCKKLCHIDPHDRGGLTCAGVSIKHNPQWFIDTLNEYDANCKPHPAGKVKICKFDLLRQKARFLYWTKYSKGIKKCPKPAYAMLVDNSVLMGLPQTLKLLQKMAGIKEDGLWGKESLKACEKFDAVKYTELRKKIIRFFPSCKKHCNGWVKRFNKKLEEYQELIRK